MSPFEVLTKECDALVRAGRPSAAAKKLSAINAASVPRRWRLPLANLCRRTGLVSVGFRLLTPVVSDKYRDLSYPPTNAELAEYAVLLQRHGSVREALGILEAIPVREAPEVLLYRTFCRVNTWDYAGTIDDLRAHFALAPNDYARLIGRVNLIAALVHTRALDEAEELARETEAAAVALKAQRLQGNVIELSAEIALAREDLDEAECRLRRAAAIFKEAQVHDQLFVAGGLAYISAARSGDVSSIITYRTEAARRGEPESVREADLMITKLTRDQALADRLYFGTPFAPFRARIRRETGLEPSSGVYHWGGPPPARLDLARPAPLTGGSKAHQTLATLLKDFYRPMPVGALFAELFPGERYDVYSSPLRIRQTIFRLRAELATAGVPLKIERTRAGYAVAATTPFAVAVTLSRGPVDAITAGVSRLRESGREAFTLTEVRQTLGLSTAGARRIVNAAIASGELERYGAGPKTRYFLRASGFVSS